MLPVRFAGIADVVNSHLPKVNGDSLPMDLGHLLLIRSHFAAVIWLRRIDGRL